MPLQWHKPTFGSSLVQEVAFDHGTDDAPSRMLVRFNNSGKIYVYPGASFEDASKIIDAESAGRAINEFKRGRDFYAVENEDDPDPRQAPAEE